MLFRSRPSAWDAVLAPGLEPRLRAGPEVVQPFVADAAPVVDAAVVAGGDSAHYSVAARVERASLPGVRDGIVCSVIELPLRAPLADVHLAPVDSPSALSGRWLRGAPPPMLTAARGLRVQVGTRALTLRSPCVECWTLWSEPQAPGVTWLQGLVSRETDRCEVGPQEVQYLPFGALYPGEPPALDVRVDVTWAPGDAPGTAGGHP